MHCHVLDKYFKQVLPLRALQIKKKLTPVSVLLVLVISTLGLEEKIYIYRCLHVIHFFHTL